MAADYITGFAETKALPKGTAAEMVKFVDNVLLRHGAIEVLTIDTGTSLAAEHTPAILQYSRKNDGRNAAYYTQKNGLTEGLSENLTGISSVYIYVEHKT